MLSFGTKSFLLRTVIKPLFSACNMSHTARQHMRRTASNDALPAGRPSVPAGIALRAGFRQHGLSFGLPSEMWGVASLALHLTKGGPGPVLTRAASAWQPFSSSVAQPQPSGDEPKSIAEALEYKPTLSVLQDVLCLLASAGICAVVYAATAPAAIQLRYAACMALLYGALVAVSRGWLLEHKYKAVQRSPRELAALDSKFLEVDGIEVHYKAHRSRQPLRPWQAAHASPASAAAAAGGGLASANTAAAAAAPGQQGQAEAPSGPQQAQQQGVAGRAVHCLHGFGASAFSWSFVLDDLARALGAVVTAHDMPGFGLTQRPSSRRYYTLGFNGEAARAVMDYELQAQAKQQQQPVGAAGAAASKADNAGVGRRSEPERVLIGHSMGGAAVAETIINNPEDISAVVLVAPAIVALWPGPPQPAKRDPVAAGLAVVEEMVSAQDAPEILEVEPSTAGSPGDPSLGAAQRAQQARGAAIPLGRTSSGAEAGRTEDSPSGSGSGSGPQATLQFRHHVARSKPLRVALAVGQAAAFYLLQVVVRLVSPLLVVLLRRLVRNRRFWERGLASAWVDKSRVDRQYVDNYRSGQLVRGWEAGILNFLAGRFSEKLSFTDTLSHVLRGDGHLSQAERLAQVVAAHNIRVLLIHGREDLLVPAANSRRLAALLPGARCVEFERCGHMPQEEMPERFVAAVAEFLGPQEEEGQLE